VQFIGVDGEGINLTTGEHRYVMLSVGDETLWNGGKELTHRDIFPFLWEQYEANPHACFVGFFLGYDFTLWLKSLPEQSAYMLFQGADLRKRSSSGKNPTPFPVYVDGWELDMLGMRRMKLRPHVCKPGRNGICACGSDVFTDENPYPWLYICDTGSYFQTSFLRVIDPDAWDDDPPCSAEEYATIKRGKSARADVYEPGDTSYLPDMKFYNQLENRILGRVMATLNKGFVSAGVKLSRSSYYGPGQAIQAWLTEKSKHVPCLTHDDIDAVIPPEVIRAWQRTYYGGRFEIFYHGIIEERHMNTTSNQPTRTQCEISRVYAQLDTWLSGGTDYRTSAYRDLQSQRRLYMQRIRTSDRYRTGWNPATSSFPKSQQVGTDSQNLRRRSVRVWSSITTFKAGLLASVRAIMNRR